MLILALALLPLGDPVQPIDFDKVSRALEREPAYVAAPRYGMFLFGPEAKTRVWTVLDKSRQDAGAYDVLYIDLDADGVLGEAGERLEAKVSGGRAVFDVGDFSPPDSEVVHTGFQLTWTPKSVRFRMLWRGETLNRGGYGPDNDSYAPFGESREEATIYVPGYDRPLEFEHWMSGTLTAGKTKSFKVFVGTRGSRVGAFSCGDDKFLPEGEYVLATLLYTDGAGKRQELQVKLEERC